MNRIVLWILALVVTNLITFVAGNYLGGRAEFEQLTRGFRVANASVEMAHYSILRDIALSLKKGNSSAAECQTELSATLMFDSTKDCLAMPECREAVTPKFREVAPELLGEKPLPITRRSECPASSTVLK